ncbi:MAG: hypothetical protein HPY80_01890 [Bacteroidales bacterium]|nr:hypothetical protein [Bacteroidales bacterium]NPV35401.1 hypothetical protein [Bacteroidales bacterium]
MEQGKQDLFTVKAIQPFPDGRQYLVLEDEKGYRFLQDYRPYANYGLKPGLKIICKVDKINCNGKVFLEPQHPWFEEGRNYVLPIVHRSSFGLFIVFEVADPGGNPHVLFSTTDTGSSNIECSIISIRKGQVMLEPADHQLRTPLPGKNGVFETHFQGITQTLPENEKIIILSWGHIPLMVYEKCFPKNHHPNAPKLCLIKTGSRMAEPVMPDLMPGQTLQLNYLTFETRPNLIKGPKTFIIAEDENKMNYEILVPASKTASLKQGDQLSVIIRAYKCGRPILELAESRNS